MLTSWCPESENLVVPTDHHDHSHLDILNQLLRGGVNWGLGVGHVLNGAGPPGGLVEQLGVEPVAVLASVHGDVPIACESSDTIIPVSTLGTKVTSPYQSPRNPAPMSSPPESLIIEFSSYLLTSSICPALHQIPKVTWSLQLRGRDKPLK